MKIAPISAVAAIMLIPSIQGQPQPPSFSAKRVLPSHSAIEAPLSPGMLFSIYGQDLGPEQGCEGRAAPASRETPDPRRAPQTILVDTTVFPRQLCAVQVFVGTEPAGLLYQSGHK